MKMKLFLKKNIKIVIAFIIGLIISGSGVYAATAAASDVSYSPPSGSGLSSNVQSAISELYNKTTTLVPKSDYNEKFFLINYDYDINTSSKVPVKGLCANFSGSIQCMYFISTSPGNVSQIQKICDALGETMTQNGSSYYCSHDDITCVAYKSTSIPLSCYLTSNPSKQCGFYSGDGSAAMCSNP